MDTWSIPHKEATVEKAATEQFKALQISKEQAYNAARAKGWVQPHATDAEAVVSAEGTGADAAETIEPVWAHTAEKYEWKEEFGEVGPRIPELENQLYRNELIVRKGLKYDK